MNRYHDAMERCAPDEGLRERLEKGVRSARPERARTYRPRRKKTAVLLLAAVLLLTTGAATIWDPLFVRRFGPNAALSALGGAVFQEVNVTSVCDDVSLTVTQALCSDRTIHYILEYRLPDGFSLGEGEYLSSPGRDLYYGTGDYTWEEFKAAEGDIWQNYDWSTNLSFGDYFDRDGFVLGPYDLTHSKDGNGNTSGSGRSKGYDPETNTITWMFSYDFNTGWDLTEQPMTILVTPPCIETEDGTRTAVTDHPAIVTFQPAYDGPQARSGVFQEGDVKITATLSTFSLALEAQGTDYPWYDDMVKDTRLVKADGSEQPVGLMGFTNGGSGIAGVDSGKAEEVSTTVHFILLTDISEYTAVRMGDYELPLS